jgi:hypothetical protein
MVYFIIHYVLKEGHHFLHKGLKNLYWTLLHMMLDIENIEANLVNSIVKAI